MGARTGKVLECFNIPCASGHLGAKVTCEELPNQPASLPVVLLCHKSSPMVEKATNQTNQLSGYQASAAIEICTILYASAQYIWEFCRCIQAFRVGPEAAYPPDYTMFAEKTESGMAISFQVNSISLEFYCFSQTREIVNCSAGQNTSSEISS